MLIKTVLRALATITVLVTGSVTNCGAALAQDLLSASRTITTKTDAEFLGNQIFTAVPPPPPPACVCTNLNQVTVICEDCDNEAREGRCFTHDRACKDAAQKGGIREHNTFFCTTPDSSNR